MKKIYQTPSVNAIFLHTRKMMALSFDKNETGADADVVLGRQDNGWDIGGSDDEAE